MPPSTNQSFNNSHSLLIATVGPVRALRGILAITSGIAGASGGLEDRGKECRNWGVGVPNPGTADALWAKTPNIKLGGFSAQIISMRRDDEEQVLECVPVSSVSRRIPWLCENQQRPKQRRGHADDDGNADVKGSSR
ncbi:hypothetical protein Q7P37_006144 [Cladosporium fusiforme]